MSFSAGSRGRGVRGGRDRVVFGGLSRQADVPPNRLTLPSPKDSRPNSMFSWCENWEYLVTPNLPWVPKSRMSESSPFSTAQNRYGEQA